MSRVGGVWKSIHQSWLAKGLGLGLLWWGFKGVLEVISFGRVQHSSNRVNGISTRTMHQSTTPFLSQTIWSRWASRQYLTLPIVQTLLPVTFAYSLSSEAVVMRQLRRWKRLWQLSFTRSHKRTSMGRSRSCWNGKQVYCNRRRLLRRGLEFHINKCAHRKKSLEAYSIILVHVDIGSGLHQTNGNERKITLYLRRIEISNASSNQRDKHLGFWDTQDLS